MKYTCLLLFLCITALSVQTGDAWFRKIFRAGKRFVSKHGKTIGAIGSVLSLFGKKDAEIIANLATLKARDRESYDEFMVDVWAALEDQYSEKDLMNMMEQLDELANLQPGEMELLRTDNDWEQNNDDGNDKLAEDLAKRVSALNQK